MRPKWTKPEPDNQFNFINRELPTQSLKVQGFSLETEDELIIKTEGGDLIQREGNEPDVQE